jgi:DNA-binding response OmpR family regulator
MDFEVSRPGRLVVVDDDPYELAALKFSFEADGCEVITLSGGKQLIEELRRQVSDCIIIDEGLEGESGLKTLTQLRACGVTTPAVLITIYSSRALRQRASALGVDIVEKPLMGDGLSRRVAALLGR